MKEKKAVIENDIKSEINELKAIMNQLAVKSHYYKAQELKNLIEAWESGKDFDSINITNNTGQVTYARDNSVVNTSMDITRVKAKVKEIKKNKYRG